MHLCLFIQTSHTSCCCSSTWILSSFVNFKSKLFPVSAKIHIYMKIEIYLKKTKNGMNNRDPPYKSKRVHFTYLFFCPLWAIPLPPLCWLRCPTGGVGLIAARGEANTRRSPETCVAPESRPTCVSPLTRLSWLAIKGSSRTARLTCDTGNRVNCFNKARFVGDSLANHVQAETRTLIHVFFYAKLSEGIKKLIYHWVPGLRCSLIGRNPWNLYRPARHYHLQARQIFT